MPKQFNPWTEEEINLIRENADKMSTKELAILLPKRSKGAIATQRQRMGIILQQVVPWTQSELSLLKEHGTTMSSKELASLLPKHSQDAIVMQKGRMGIKLSKESLSKMRQEGAATLDYSVKLEDLDNVTFQILIGSILGDGCITTNGDRKNHFFREEHCFAQTDYAKWKVGKLEFFKPVLWECAKMVQYTTKQHPIFTGLRDKFYVLRPALKSIIPLDLIAKLDYLGLLIWYFDDGTLNMHGYRTSRKKYKGQPTIIVKGWDTDNLKQAVNKINEKLNLSLYVSQYKGGKVISITAENRDKLFSIWIDLFEKQGMPKCMSYKLGFN